MIQGLQNALYAPLRLSRVLPNLIYVLLDNAKKIVLPIFPCYLVNLHIVRAVLVLGKSQMVSKPLLWLLSTLSLL